MAVLRLTCPWCGLEQSAFEVLTERKVDRGEYHEYRQVLAECGGCRQWVLLDGRVPLNFHDAKLTDKKFEIDQERFFEGTIRTYPKPQSDDAPAHTPPAPARSYSQAVRALKRKDWEPAGVMARRALEQATDEMKKGFIRDDNLKKRIDSLAKDGTVTEQLRDWAHTIRDLGNDAAHGEFGEREAREIIEFTETFFEYIFTMPKKLADRRAETEEKQANAKPA